jgi:hypothetical protein
MNGHSNACVGFFTERMYVTISSLGKGLSFRMCSQLCSVSAILCEESQGNQNSMRYRRQTRYYVHRTIESVEQEVEALLKLGPFETCILVAGGIHGHSVGKREGEHHRRSSIFKNLVKTLKTSTAFASKADGVVRRWTNGLARVVA